MSNLDDIMKDIAGQSPKESINKEAEEQLKQVVNNDESPDDSVEPVENDGDEVAEPEVVDTPTGPEATEGGNEDDEEQESEPTASEQSDEEDLVLEFDVEAPTDAPSNEIDLSPLAKELGTEVKSINEVAEKVRELKSTLQTLETSSGLNDIPAELSKAVEIAKKGGDYKAVLEVSSQSYDKADPVEVYEQYVESQLADENGNVDYEQLDEYLDGISDVDKTIRGKELIAQRMSEQKAKLRELELAADERRRAANKAIQDAVQAKDKIAGFKLKPEHKQVLINGIQSGKMVQELFNDDKGGYDFDKMAETYFKVKFFDNIQKVYESRIKNSTKKEILNQTTNPKIERPVEPSKAEGNKKSPLDVYFESLMQK